MYGFWRPIIPLPLAGDICNTTFIVIWHKEERMKQCENEHALLNSCQTHSAHHCSTSFHLSEQENRRVKLAWLPAKSALDKNSWSILTQVTLMVPFRADWHAAVYAPYSACIGYSVRKTKLQKWMEQKQAEIFNACFAVNKSTTSPKECVTSDVWHEILYKLPLQVLLVPHRQTSRHDESNWYLILWMLTQHSHKMFSRFIFPLFYLQYNHFCKTCATLIIH